ncbi:MAG: hypothetical protein HOG49_41875 [Candidatus Scalindua sp.]|jgi:hypothetical protein|nr:hypothetical protein [Candidatus Scalindua sp.]
MSRKDYIRDWRQANPEKVAQYNKDYYLRNKAGLVNGKPQGTDKYCPNCNLLFKSINETGNFVSLKCAKCGYSRLFNKDEFYGT